MVVVVNADARYSRILVERVETNYPIKNADKTEGKTLIKCPRTVASLRPVKPVQQVFLGD